MAKHRKMYEQIYNHLKEISSKTDKLRYSFESHRSIIGLRGEKCYVVGREVDYERECFEHLENIKEDITKTTKYIEELKRKEILKTPARKEFNPSTDDIEMNKYQEALKNIEIIKDFIDTQRREGMLGRTKNFSSEYLIKTFQEIHNAYYLVKELVDKATPQKIVKLPKKQLDYAYLCPSCGKVLGKVVTGIKIPYFEEDKYCCNCGQAIDWRNK